MHGCRYVGLSKRVRKSAIKILTTEDGSAHTRFVLWLSTLFGLLKFQTTVVVGWTLLLCLYVCYCCFICCLLVVRVYYWNQGAGFSSFGGCSLLSFSFHFQFLYVWYHFAFFFLISCMRAFMTLLHWGGVTYGTQRDYLHHHASTCHGGQRDRYYYKYLPLRSLLHTNQVPVISVITI